MPLFPQPPINPETLEAFAAHAQEHPALWYDYWQQSYEWMSNQVQQTKDLQEKVAYLNDRTTELETSRILAQGKYQAILERCKEKESELDEARQTKLRTVRDLTPSSAFEKAETTTANGLGTTPPLATESATSSCLSERQPDPDRFSGERKDLRRFTAQIRQKLNVNHDRFPTPQSRMTYVSGRLLGTPYSLILPYIVGGRCTLPDYESILDILEQAYGDPNRIRNAREKLYYNRQKNRELSEFIADFQRLAMEGEVTDESKRVILDQAISSELKDMLVHHDPPPHASFNEYTSFLQGLENRMRQRHTWAPPYKRAQPPPQEHRAIYRSPPPPRGRSPRKRSPLVDPTAAAPGEPMDLSHQRRSSTRKENGECFRCGSRSHFIRDCPKPDNRPARIQNARYTTTSPRKTPSPPRTPRQSRSPRYDSYSSALSGSREFQENGARLD